MARYLNSDLDLRSGRPLTRLVDALTQRGMIHIGGRKNLDGGWFGITELTVCSSMDEVSALEGGLAFMRGGDVLLVPRCCGDLQDRYELRATLEDNRDEWVTVWMGHPHIAVRCSNNVVEISPSEDATAAPFALQREKLVRALDGVEEEIARSLPNIACALERMTRLDAMEVARSLVHGMSVV